MSMVSVDKTQTRNNYCILDKPYFSLRNIHTQLKGQGFKPKYIKFFQLSAQAGMDYLHAHSRPGTATGIRGILYLVVLESNSFVYPCRCLGSFQYNCHWLPCISNTFLNIFNYNWKDKAATTVCVFLVCFHVFITRNMHIRVCHSCPNVCVSEWASLLSPVVMPASLRLMRSAQCHGWVSSPLASQEESGPATELSALQRNT